MTSGGQGPLLHHPGRGGLWSKTDGSYRERGKAVFVEVERQQGAVSLCCACSRCGLHKGSNMLPRRCTLSPLNVRLKASGPVTVGLG